MSKYDPLWKYISQKESSLNLSFEDVEKIIGLPIDHSFLKYKRELEPFGFKVGKISMKNHTVFFEKL